MAAGTIRHEVEIAGARRIGRGLQRGPPGIGNRSWRQAVDYIGVIGRGLRDFAALDRPAQRPLAAHQPIDDGRVRLQFYLLPQAIDKYRGDPAPLIGLAGFLLDDRGQCHELVRRFKRDIRAAAFPDFGERAFLRLLHALDHLVARGAAREFIGLRQQRALARDFAYRACKNIIVGKPRHDLLRRQSFGDRDRVLDHFALDDGADDVAQAGALLERIFARFQFGACLHRQHRADERPTVVVDHALALQHVGDIGHSGPRRNVDDLVLLQRTRRFQLLSAVVVGSAGADHPDQQ